MARLLKFFSFLFLFSFFALLLWQLQVPLPSEERPLVFVSNVLHEDIDRTLLNAISSAKKTVDVALYSLKDPRFIQALKKCADSGVEVHLVYDAKASGKIRKYLGENVKQLAKRGRGLSHLKLLVIDGEMSFVGSANWTRSSMREHSNIVAGVWSKTLGSFIQQKIRSMVAETNAQYPLKKFEFGQMHFFPDDEWGAQYLRSELSSAKKSVRIAMFTWTREDLADSVIAAYRRGVDVEVILDESSARGTSRKIFQKLVKAKVPLWVSKGPGLMHTKLLVVDGKTVIQGSANWTKGAFTKNDDCYIVLQDLSSSDRNYFDKFWSTLKRWGVEDVKDFRARLWKNGKARGGYRQRTGA